MDKLANYFLPNWTKDQCEIISKFKPEIQILILKYCIKKSK